MKKNHEKSSTERGGARRLGRYLRWSLTVVAVGLGLSSFIGWLRFLERSGRVYALPRASMAIERTPAALARGEHLARGLAGCAECHGADFGGRVLVETPLFRAVAPNLTRGKGSAIGSYSERDWANAIVHGVRPNQRSLLLMPSKEVGSFADADVAAMIAFLQALPAVDRAPDGLDISLRERFYRDLYFIDHRTDDALSAIVPLYGSAFTVSRQNVIADRQWQRSVSVNERFRPLGCDDFVLSMMPVASLGVISSMDIYRDRGTRFSERERLFIDLLHEELAHDWKRIEPEQSARLTPRQRQVLAQLLAGASEKELAYDLNVSPHTVHEHIKAIHRAFGARSRGELLARVAKAKGQGQRTRLIAEQA